MPPVPFEPSKNMKKKKQQPLNRFDPGTPASNAVDITTTLQYLLTWRTQVNILWVSLYYIPGNCKQNITWLSLFVGTIVQWWTCIVVLKRTVSLSNEDTFKMTHCCLTLQQHRIYSQLPWTRTQYNGSESWIIICAVRSSVYEATFLITLSWLKISYCTEQYRSWY